MIELQDDFQGFWRGAGSLESQQIATSFALLFLSKGKRQVVIGRLQYPEDGEISSWQRHPDSLRQLVRHVEYEWRRDLTWQTIELADASTQDLLQAPVLVISGNGPLNIRPSRTRIGSRSTSTTVAASCSRRTRETDAATRRRLRRAFAS